MPLGSERSSSFSVTTGEPIAFYLHQDGDKDADVLDHLVQKVCTILGVKKLGVILFDKDYWRVDEFKDLVEEQRWRPNWYNITGAFEP